MIDTPTGRPSTRDDGDSPPPAPRREPTPLDPSDTVEEASKESFPASDAPGWAPLHPGRPGQHPDHDRR